MTPETYQLKMTIQSSNDSKTRLQPHVQHILKSAVGIAAIGGTVLAACPDSLAQRSPSPANELSLPVGTVIPVILITELSSNRSVRGDTFVTTIDNTKQAYANMMPCATVTGTVVEASPRQGGAPGTLDLSFNALKLIGGKGYPLIGSLSSLNLRRLNVSSTGILQARSTSKESHLTIAGIGSGGGELVGSGIPGYSAADLVKNPGIIHDVDLKPGTLLGVLLTDTLYFKQRPVEDATTPLDEWTYIRKDMKYYWFKGQLWALNIPLGERFVISGLVSTPTEQP